MLVSDIVQDKVGLTQQCWAVGSKEQDQEPRSKNLTAGEKKRLLLIVNRTYDTYISSLLYLVQHCMRAPASLLFPLTYKYGKSVGLAPLPAPHFPDQDQKWPKPKLSLIINCFSHNLQSQ